MLRSINGIIGLSVEASDGSIGKVRDLLFDDRHWRLRYFVVDTGNWLPGRKVLVSPLHAKEPEKGLQTHRFPVSLTKQEVKESPELSTDAPVSDLYEEEFARYYQGLVPYWSGPNAWGFAAEPAYYPAVEPGETLNKGDMRAHDARLRKIEHSHLRSAEEIIGYNIAAKDDHFGHVEDFILDDSTWKLQYLVVDTRNWLPGKKSLVDIEWVQDLNWSEKTAAVDLARKQIKAAPEFNPSEPINRDYEERLYDYYGRPRHWEVASAMYP